MLPDFAKVRKPISDAVTHALREMVRQRPLIGSFAQEHFFEGHAWGGYGEDVDDGKHGFREIQTPSTVPTQELIERGPDALLSRLPELASAMADQMEKRMMERIAESAEAETGHAIIAAGVPATCDEWIENLRKMEISFDESGAAELPMVIGSRDLAMRLLEWENDSHCKAKLQAMLQEKREEFDAREGNRKLGD